MNKLRIFTFLFACCFASFQYVEGQDSVKVVLTVVEIDKAGERPAANKQVTIIPKNQGVAFNRTDVNGQIAFSFPSTESVTFRVGEIGNDVRLQPLSGRTNQSTSFLIDKRSNQNTVSYQTVAAGGPVFSGRVFGFFQLLDDLESQSGGRLMNQQSREYLQSLRPAIIKETTPGSDATEIQSKRLANARSQLLTRIDEMLKAPFRMGANVQNSTLGAVVASVQQGGPADVAGLKPSDIITHVGFSSVVDSPQTFRWLIANAPEAKTNVKVIRGNQKLQLSISLIR